MEELESEEEESGSEELESEEEEKLRTNLPLLLLLPRRRRRNGPRELMGQPGLHHRRRRSDCADDRLGHLLPVQDDVAHDRATGVHGDLPVRPDRHGYHARQCRWLRQELHGVRDQAVQDDRNRLLLHQGRDEQRCDSGH